jgi:hypothetical protein
MTIMKNNIYLKSRYTRILRHQAVVFSQTLRLGGPKIFLLIYCRIHIDLNLQAGSVPAHNGFETPRINIL